MSWRKQWTKRQDGKYVYQDKLIKIPYIIDEGLYAYLESLSDSNRDEVLMKLMMQAAEAIGRNPALTEYESSLDTSP